MMTWWQQLKGWCGNKGYDLFLWSRDWTEEYWGEMLHENCRRKYHDLLDHVDILRQDREVWRQRYEYILKLQVEAASLQPVPPIIIREVKNT